MEVTAEI